MRWRKASCHCKVLWDKKRKGQHISPLLCSVPSLLDFLCHLSVGPVLMQRVHSASPLYVFYPPVDITKIAPLMPFSIIHFQDRDGGRNLRAFIGLWWVYTQIRRAYIFRLLDLMQFFPFLLVKCTIVRTYFKYFFQIILDIQWVRSKTFGILLPMDFLPSTACFGQWITSKAKVIWSLQ